MAPREPSPKPQPPLDVEGGLESTPPPPDPDSKDGMLGEGGLDRGDDARDGGMLGES